MKTIPKCLTCGKSLELCPYPDYKGKDWWWCWGCDAYFHQDDLDHQAEADADWDNRQMFKELRQGLY